MSVTSEFLTTGQVAKITGFSILKVRMLVEQGKIPATNTSCGTRPRWTIRRCDLDEFLTPRSVAKAESHTATRRRRIDAGVPQIF